jgi:plastocyanin
MSQGSPKSGTVTVTFKLKYLWLVVGVAMLLLAMSPIVYLYTNNGSSSSGGSGAAPPPSTPPNCPSNCQVIIQNSQFGNGQPVIVKAGSTITWVNRDDTTHTSTSNSNLWNTGILAPGASSKPVTFSTPGTYPYFCEVHPMNGVVIVVS